ncbi:MAG: hypothetical protein GY817_00810 [bacterium]|nr:hypothetical protein [bacterium]
MNLDRYISTTEAGKIIKVSRGTICRMIKENDEFTSEVEVLQPGLHKHSKRPHFLINKEEFLTYLKSNRVRVQDRYHPVFNLATARG